MGQPRRDPETQTTSVFRDRGGHAERRGTATESEYRQRSPGTPQEPAGHEATATPAEEEAAAKEEAAPSPTKEEAASQEEAPPSSQEGQASPKDDAPSLTTKYVLCRLYMCRFLLCTGLQNAVLGCGFPSVQQVPSACAIFAFKL